MRQPLEAQVPAAAKVLKAELIECNSIRFIDSQGQHRGSFEMVESNGTTGFILSLTGDSGSISLSTFGPEPELAIDHDTTHLRLRSNGLRFEQEEPGARKFNRQITDLTTQFASESDPKKREEAQSLLAKAIDQYQKLVRVVIDLGIDQKGAGKFRFNNLLGAPVVELFSDRGNSGVVVVRDANGRPVFTAPPSTR